MADKIREPQFTNLFADLRNSDLNSEVFLRKLHRAHEALSQSDSNGSSTLKTLSASFGAKWPYKRTMSAPASIVPRPDIKGIPIYWFRNGTNNVLLNITQFGRNLFANFQYANKYQKQLQRQPKCYV